MNAPTTITAGSVQQAQHETQQTGSQKHHTNPEPPKGSQADHPIYGHRQPTWATKATRAMHDGTHATGTPPPEAATGTRLTATDGVAKPFQDASTAPHTSLLMNPDDRERFVKLLIKLGAVAAKCAKKTVLKQTDWESAYEDYKAATKLNNQCAQNLKEHAADHAANLGQHILETEKVLKTVYHAVQLNRGLFAGHGK